MKKLTNSQRLCRLHLKASRKIEKLQAIENSGGKDNKLYNSCASLICQMGKLRARNH